LGAQFPAADLATANTVFVMVYCLGGVIGPSVGGVALDHWPHQGLPLLLSGAPPILLAALMLPARSAGQGDLGRA
jgi:MFS family permease